MFLAALFLAIFFQSETNPAASPSFVVQNVRIFDGREIIPSGEVLAQDGKIVRVGKVGEIPEGVARIDGAGKTLLPGLIDCHTHTFMPYQLQRALVFGVTTELDMFTRHQLAAHLRKKQSEGGSDDMADLFSAGTLITAPGGHGTQFGVPIPTLEKPEDAQAFIDARIAEGSDYIKIVYEHARPTLSLETVRAAIAAAHQREKLAVVHISKQQEAMEAIGAGANGLVHIFYDSAPEASFAKEAAAKKIFVIPTLSVLESACGIAGSVSLAEDPRLAPYLSQAEKDHLKKPFSRPSPLKDRFGFAQQAVRQLKEAGVDVLAGTDAPNPGNAHGPSMHRELELLVEVGLSPVEALAAATSIPAARFRLADRGRIAPGLRADLLLVNGDPSKDIRATRDIVNVWKQGVSVTRPIQEQPEEKKE